MAENQINYTIQPVVRDDEKNILDLLKRTFFIDEPLNQTVGLCDDGVDTCKEVEEYCRHSLFEGYSFKAIDKDENIVGIMISGICPLKEEDNGNDLKSQAQRCPNPKFQKILHILARREEGARLWELYPKETNLLEIKVAANDPKWRRKGIMNALLGKTEELAKARGIKLLRIDTSSAYSAKSADRLHFKCVYKAKYSDILLDGKPLIVPEPPHLEDRVYIKELS